MADDNTTGQTSADAAAQAGPQLHVLTQYVKDMSFENPNAPSLLGQLQGQPNIDVRVDVGVKRMADADYEVALKIAVDAKIEGKALFLVELEYAGLFRLENIPEDQLEPVLVIECPRQIFPFARRMIADVTRDGGYPPLLLDPIDFVSLYQQRRAQMQAEVAGAKPN